MDTDINYIIQESIKGNKECQEVLLNRLKPLIYKNIYHFYSKCDNTVEDLAQDGYLIILESLKEFDESQHVHFLGFIKSNLRFYYKNYYRNTKQLRQSISLNKKIYNTGNSVEFGDIIENTQDDLIDNIIKNEEMIEMLNNFHHLSKKNQEVLYLYYKENLSMIEISNKLNIAYRTAISRKYTAILQLKKSMNISPGGEYNG